eukprot:gene34485-24362_t
MSADTMVAGAEGALLAGAEEVDRTPRSGRTTPQRQQSAKGFGLLQAAALAAQSTQLTCAPLVHKDSMSVTVPADPDRPTGGAG